MEHKDIPIRLLRSLNGFLWYLMHLVRIKFTMRFSKDLVTSLTQIELFFSREICNILRIFC